jgi:predicted dehydrogenase
MINIAYVGFGKSTNRYHLPYVAQRLDKFKVSRIVTPTLGKRPEDQATWEARGTIFSTDLADIINDQTIDLVVIVTPAPTHFETAKQLLSAGKNVLVDKPMVETPDQAQELVDLAEKNNLVFMPFQNRRFDSDFLTLKHVIETGYVGRPVDLEVHMDHYRPNAGQPTGSMIDGAWYGHGVHLVDQIISLFGRPQTVAYDLRHTRLPEATLDDQFEVSLFYENQFKATVQATELALVPYPKWILHGTRGSYIKYDIDQQEYDLKAGIMPGAPGFGDDAPQTYGKVTYLNQNGDRIEKTIPSIHGDYGQVYDAMYDSLVNGTPKLVSDAEMLTVIDILHGGFDAPSPSTKQL